MSSNSLFVNEITINCMRECSENESTFCQQTNGAIVSVIVWVNWIAVYIVQILIITLTCYKTTNVAKSTAEVISHLLSEFNLHPKVKNKLMVFIKQIQHEDVQCSPFNLFTIDTSLLFSVSTAFIFILKSGL
ncbi:unnamed protein product [Acanthoscelides obtectus]|uniref:Uncharacterized protein n=1 Tax=Acanthoscelides obtectus TaxID=200917 RepID=A0A9P0P090_ACAOB|nr:unnamed protein product [Acanthoscelides obtectus]CAK1632581.1 hypothetical protein AOBTE_LOCUS7629 [Acanthoscelides obtectus]